MNFTPVFQGLYIAEGIILGTITAVPVVLACMSDRKEPADNDAGEAFTGKIPMA